mgnify:CR=1 FL=1
MYARTPFRPEVTDKDHKNFVAFFHHLTSSAIWWYQNFDPPYIIREHLLRCSVFLVISHSEIDV